MLCLGSKDTLRYGGSFQTLIYQVYTAAYFTRTDLLSNIIQRRRSKPMPIGRGSDIEQDGEGVFRLVLRVEDGDVWNVAAEGDLPVV